MVLEGIQLSLSATICLSKALQTQLSFRGLASVPSLPVPDSTSARAYSPLEPGFFSAFFLPLLGCFSLHSFPLAFDLFGFLHISFDLLVSSWLKNG